MGEPRLKGEIRQMRVEDRLKKAKEKLRDHQFKCRRCEERTSDPTIGECTIAHKLAYDIKKIRKQMEGI